MKVKAHTKVPNSTQHLVCFYSVLTLIFLLDILKCEPFDCSRCSPLFAPIVAPKAYIF